MIGKKIRIIAAVVGCILLFCSCTGNEIKEFDALREKAERKSGIVYRTTYFLSTAEEEKEGGFPYPLLKDGKYCYACLDENGKEIILTPAAFTDARGSYEAAENQFIAPAAMDGKWGYVLLNTTDPNTDVVTWAIETKYDNAERFTEQVAAVCMDGLYGIINISGDFLLAPYYDSIKYCSFGTMPAEKDGEWYFININGQRLFGPFEDAESFEYGFAAVKKDGKWGFIDKSGLDATAFVYDEAYSVETEIEKDKEVYCAWVRTGDEWEKVVIKQ